MSVASPLTDRTLGEFSVREKIGEGGFGAVYRAEQTTLGREAVVKVLHDRHAASKMEQRFLREAQLASRLDHPYAAHIYAFGAEPDGLLWIAMEYVRGTPLDRLLDRGPIPVERFVPLLERLAEVIQTAHDQRIIHRDIKPANVMVLERAGRLLPKLLDLGIARLLDEGSEITGPPAPPPVRPVLSTTAGDDDSFEDDDTTGSRRAPSDTLPRITIPKVTPDAATFDARRPGATPPPRAASSTPSSTPRLTGHGAAMGSPPYMAPEQWADTSQIDWRADIYALGVMTYEALTGRLPFEAKNAYEMSRAHATEPVPALGPGFPPALDAVIARAMAKRPEDRWAGAVAFAAAAREAAGLGEASEVLPHVDDAQRTWLLEQAPQPIAEAAALLDAARSAHQLRAAARGVVRPILRWLAALALAARTRDAPRSVRSTDTDEAAELLRMLRRRDLVEEEVVALIRELVRGFAEKPHTHPLPELVETFFPRGRADLALFDDLVRERPDEPAADVVTGLGRLVEAVRFLDRYPVVVAGPERAEKWVGLRRPSRPSFRLAGPGVEPGQALLVDLAGRPVLPLHPLVQLTSPTPGAPPEMFLFVGRGRTGARLVAFPLGFEQQDPAVWSWLGARFFDSEDSLERTGEDVRPYRGLAAFQSEDSQSFFGRESETDALLNRLRVQPVVAVVGPSGAGKSSFVHAGVLPALPEGWRAITVRPGPTPLVALAARLGLSPLPDDVGEALRARAASAGETLVLVVDQLEELFTVCTDAAARVAFAAAVCRAARSADDPVRVIFTLRDDFLMRAEQLPDLREALARGLMLLGTPEPAALRRILIEPARRAGYDFEDNQLIDEMVAEVADLPGALPLLSFTAAELWSARDPHFKKLGRRAYEALGGVGGALAKHAEATLAALPDGQQRLVRQAFRHLVTAEGTRAVLTRAELLEVLGAEAAPVLEQLILARLLVASDTETGGERIEIIHEALLAGWPRLAGWLREDAEGARLRDQLRSAGRQWDERGRPAGLLWRGEALVELRLWRARHGSALTAVEEAFAQASEREAARGRRLRNGLLGGAVAVLAATSAVLFWSQGKATTAAAQAVVASREAKRRFVDLLLEQGRLAMLDGEEHKALAYLVAATKRGADGPMVRLLVARAAAAVDLQLVSFNGHTDELYAAEWSPDEKRIVTAGFDGTARVWDVASGRTLAVLGGHAGRVNRAYFAPDGDRVVTAAFDGHLRVFDAATGRLEQDAPISGTSFEMEVSPRGDVVATGDAEGNVRLHPIDDVAAAVALPARHEGEVSAVHFDRGGSRLYSMGAEGVTFRFDPQARTLVQRFGGHTDLVRDVAQSIDGRELATIGHDRVARVWDLGTGALVTTLEGHAARLRSGDFSPDGQQIVTGSEDHTAKIWNATTGKLVLSLEGHTANVTRVEYSADGRRVVTACSDGSVRVWDAQSGELLSRLVGHTFWVRIRLSRDGTRVLTSSGDGTAKIWRADHDERSRVLDGPLGGVVAWGKEGLVDVGAAGDFIRIGAEPGEDHAGSLGTTRLGLAPTGDVVLASGAMGVEIRRLGGGPPSGSFQPPDNAALGFSPDGHRVLVADRDGNLTVLDEAAREVARVSPNLGPLFFAVASPDGRSYLTTTDASPAAFLLDATTGKVTAELAGHTRLLLAMTFSADGRLAATGGLDRIARVWDGKTGKPLATMQGHDEMVRAVTFSPDGLLLATAGYDRTVRVWDTTTGVELVRYLSHPRPVSSVAFSPDGSQLASASDRGLVVVHRVVPVRSIGLSEAEEILACRVPYRVDQESARLERVAPPGCAVRAR